MSCYWAKFEKRESHIFRFDTRVYLNSREHPSDNDPCIGAIVGKNPGSALPSNLNNTALQKVVLDNDRLLPTIRSIFLKAYKHETKAVVKNSYIQVLNLMYVCDSELTQAIRKNEEYPRSIICDTEGRDFPFLWYVWGGDNKKLNIYKQRFYNLKTKLHYYFDPKTDQVVSRAPGMIESARHTQGLNHALILPYISSII